MDIRKLQRVIVDGLEDVKAQDILVFNTEHLSPLFERVIIASGNSNRQTKALASSVRVAVKAAGLEVLRTEGEDNGEWIIVDCGSAVAHIMQPAIRQYYHLEEIWGGKPVRLKLGAAQQAGLAKASEPMAEAAASPAKPARAPRKAAPRQAATAESGAGKLALGEAKAAKPAPARKVTVGTVKPAAKSPAKAPAKSASKAPAKAAPKAASKASPKTAGAKPAVKTTRGGVAPAKKAAIKTIVVKPAARKAPAKKAAAGGRAKAGR